MTLPPWTKDFEQVPSPLTIVPVPGKELLPKGSSPHSAPEPRHPCLLVAPNPLELQLLSLLNSPLDVKDALCPATLSSDFSVPFLPFNTKLLWFKMLTQVNHQILHGFPDYILSESVVQKKKKKFNHKLYTQNVDEFPQGYLVQEWAIFLVKERSGACDVWLVTRWKK